MRSDRAVQRIARSQDGLVTRRQALDAGATPRTISGRLNRGAWRRLYPAVYLIDGRGIGHAQEIRGALLWAGEDSILSHRSAAELLEIPGGDGKCVDITTPRRLRSGDTHVNFHFVRNIESSDVVVTNGLPHSDAVRTLIDLCEIASSSTIETALDEVLRRRMTSLPALKLRLSSADVVGRPGTSHLRRLVMASDVTESPLERTLLRVLRHSGLPELHRQYELKGRGRKVARLDFAYPEAKIGIECDGYRWHSERSRWENDIERRNFINAMGWRVIQVTSRALRERPHEVVDAIEAALLLSGKPGLSRPSRAKKYRRAT